MKVFEYLGMCNKIRIFSCISLVRHLQHPIAGSHNTQTRGNSNVSNENELLYHSLELQIHKEQILLEQNY